jgi:hypothetical protein
MEKQKKQIGIFHWHVGLPQVLVLGEFTRHHGTTTCNKSAHQILGIGERQTK